jgi:hypothetical protein
MSGSKHEKSAGEGPFTSDLDDDPGIGQSAGLFATGEDPDLLEGENTSEGDIDNDATAGGGAGEKRVGRANG